MRPEIFYVAWENRRTLDGKPTWDLLIYFYTLEEAKTWMYEQLLDMARTIDTGDKTAEEYVEEYYCEESRVDWDDSYERYTIYSIGPF